MSNVTLIVAAVAGAAMFLFSKKFSKRKSDSVKTAGAVLAVLAILAMNMGWDVPDPIGEWQTDAQPAAVSPPKVTATGSCAYAPTFTLTAADKWSSGLVLSASHLYQLNNGGSQTYSGAVNSNLGDTVDVLWGNGNVTYYNEKDSYTISQCGLNTLPSEGVKKLVANTSVTVQCFDENGDVINDVTQNMTIGSGEAATVSCRLKLDTAERGMPHGAVLVVELASGTVYDEGQTQVTGSAIQTKTSVPGFFTEAAAANKAVAFDIAPILDTGYKDFSVYVKAESGQNPTATNDITLRLYSKDCFENSDTGRYECGVEDEDSNMAGDLLGTEVITVD